MDKTLQGNCYKLIAACFYEPDKNLFIEEKVCENLADTLKKIAPEAESAAKGMQDALSASDTEEMLVEYAGLFVGPFELIAPPYGSLYLEKSNQLMGDSTIAVLKQYEDAGLAVDAKEPPDHIALELEFLYYLCMQKPDSDSVPRHDVFLRSFLAPWVPDFCNKIRQGTENSFYRNLADCLELFVEKALSLSQNGNSLQTPEEKYARRASA